MSTSLDPLFWIILAIAAVLVIAGSLRKHRAPSTAVFRYKIVSVVPDDAGKRATMVMLQGPSGIVRTFVARDAAASLKAGDAYTSPLEITDFFKEIAS